MSVTVKEAAENLKLTPLNLADGGKTIGGVYTGDLLSWIMGHAEESDALITIMSNINVLAVASLKELSCVVICENVIPDNDFLKTAREKEINILSSRSPAYEVCVAFSELLGK